MKYLILSTAILAFLCDTNAVTFDIPASNRESCIHYNIKNDIAYQFSFEVTTKNENEEYEEEMFDEKNGDETKETVPHLWVKITQESGKTLYKGKIAGEDSVTLRSQLSELVKVCFYKATYSTTDLIVTSDISGNFEVVKAGKEGTINKDMEKIYYNAINISHTSRQINYWVDRIKNNILVTTSLIEKTSRLAMLIFVVKIVLLGIYFYNRKRFCVRWNKMIAEKQKVN
eukprot:GAHX01001811.1.p1 GENE.GAHX01001811.1~~GAHX01001811.1.p1  ORF type:complete len:229 (-),score=32.72 GAHX01001811.1:132-818(-)